MSNSSPQQQRKTARIAVIATVAVAAFFGGCSSPSHTEQPEASRQFGPWTPSRMGRHPAEFATPSTPNSRRREAETSGPSILAESPGAAALFFAWRAYSHTFSRAMGETCRFEPTCSRFAVEAFRRTGLAGAVLTFGRLQRNHANDEGYPKSDDGYLADPVSNYFFWRSDAGLRAHRTSMATPQAWYVFLEAAEQTAMEVGDE